MRRARQLLPDGPSSSGVQFVRNIPLEEFHFAQSVAKNPVKVTLIGPDRIAHDLSGNRQRASTKTWMPSSPMSLPLSDR